MKSTNELNEFAINIINTVREPLLVLDKNLRVIKASRSFYNFFRVTPDETIGVLIYELGNGQWNIPKLKELLETILLQKTTFDDYEVEHDFSTIGKRILLLNAQQIERTLGKEKIILIAIEDITAQRCSEKKNKVSEEEFREVVEHSPDAIFITDCQGRYIYINTNAVRMLGYSKEEMLLLTIADISPKNRLEEYFEIFKQTIQEGSFFAEIQLLKKDGNLLTTDLNTALLPNGHIYGSCRDITDRKRADESLRESHQIIEEIINSIPVRVFWKDKNLTYLGCNNLFARDAGFTNPKELIGKDDFQMGWRDQAELYREDDFKVIESGISRLLIEEPQTTPEGNNITLLTSKIPLLNSKGEIIGVLGTYMDITERKLAEEKLQESEEKYRELVEASPDAIIIQCDAIIVFANRSSASMMRATSIDELIGKSVFEFVHPSYKEIIINNMIELEKTGEALPFAEEKFLRIDGSEIDVEVKARPIVYDKKFAVQLTVRDITERKQIESALKTSEERFRTAAETLTDVIYEWDIKQKLDWYGDIDGITGYPPGEFPRTIEGWEAVIHPEDKDRIITALENHINGTAPYNTEYRIKRSDGGWRWWSARGTALRDDQGNPYKMIGSITDITEQKDVQNRIKFKSELLSHIGQSVIATDLQGKVIYWNNGAEEIYGWSSAEAIGQNIVDLTPTEQTKENAAEIMKALSEGSSWSGEFLVKRKDGSIFPADVTDAPIIDSDGKLIGVVGISSDITERKRTEIERKVLYEITYGVTTTNNLDELLKLIHQSLSKVVYAENCFVALHDQNTGLFSFPFYEDKYDPTPKTAPLDKSCTSYVFRTGKSLLLSDRLFEQMVEQGEVELIGTNSPSWIGVPLKINFNTIGVLVLQHYEKENVYTERDIMFLEAVGREIAHVIERKLTEEETQKHNKQLFKLNAEKDKFFSIIAHDLKSPLSSLLNMTELMADNTENFSQAEFIENSKLLNESARNLYKLLENLLEWAQIQKGTIEFTPKDFDLSKLVSRSIDTISQWALQKKIEIKNEIHNSQKVYADEKIIETILRNLLSNAVKFTKTGGEVIVKTKRFENSTIQVSIEDNGVGISEDNVKKLFKIDQKVGSIGTEGEPSTGLGLLLCKEFVEMHGQRIWVESVKDKGSTFCFTLQEENCYETK